jgi:3-hydroxyisobutyrate dehydrogenase-like beta-hydroxyacid dehydrogenase
LAETRRNDAIALIGFGEVGQILAWDLAGAGVEDIRAWDIAFDRPESAPSRALATHPVRPADSAVDAARGASLVISAVTAEEDLQAAQSVAPGLAPGAFFLDLNSCSPGQKVRSAAVIEAAGGRYVEVAVMNPIAPRRIASSMLLGGPHAGDFLASADGLGFLGAQVFSPVIGQAAAAKLCRSVITKGVEALLIESMLAARRHGVEQTVLASLSDLLPLPDWPATARYMIGRSLEHGARRAEEMREAARTVAEASVEPLLSEAIAVRQAWTAGFAEALGEEELGALLDAINSRIDREGPRSTAPGAPVLD